MKAYLPSESEGDNVLQFTFRVEGTEDPPCHTEDPLNLRLELRADQPTPLAQRTVSWRQGTDMPQQPRQSLPRCQADLSLDPWFAAVPHEVSFSSEKAEEEGSDIGPAAGGTLGQVARIAIGD